MISAEFTGTPVAFIKAVVPLPAPLRSVERSGGVAAFGARLRRTRGVIGIPRSTRHVRLDRLYC